MRVTSGPRAGECGEVVTIHRYPAQAGGEHVLVWVRLDRDGGTDAFSPARLEVERAVGDNSF